MKLKSANEIQMNEVIKQIQQQIPNILCLMQDGCARGIHVCGHTNCLTCEHGNDEDMSNFSIFTIDFTKKHYKRRFQAADMDCITLYESCPICNAFLSMKERIIIEGAH